MTSLVWIRDHRPDLNGPFSFSPSGFGFVGHLVHGQKIPLRSLCDVMDLFVGYIPERDLDSVRFRTHSPLDPQISDPMVRNQLSACVSAEPGNQVIDHGLGWAEPAPSDRNVIAIESKSQSESIVISEDLVGFDIRNPHTPYCTHSRVLWDIQRSQMVDWRSFHLGVINEQARQLPYSDPSPDPFDRIVEDHQNWMNQVVEIEWMTAAFQRRHHEGELRTDDRSAVGAEDRFLPLDLTLATGQHWLTRHEDGSHPSSTPRRSNVNSPF